MTFFKWSQVKDTNNTADSTCPFPEGQSPSSLNDGSRGQMAALAKYRDDISGAILTGGTSSAYTVASYQGFDTLAHLSGQMIAFTPHATNAGTCTLNLDGLTAKPLRSAPGIELPAGTIIQGTPYLALYNNSDGAFYLHGFYGSPYSIPISGSIEYWGPTTPNSSFAFPFGQALNRTVYSSLFSGNPWSIGTTFGVGDGSTTFNLPDVRGRITACPDTMGGSDASRLTVGALSGVRSSIGGTGGEAAHTLVAGEIPVITSALTLSASISQTGIVQYAGGTFAGGVTLNGSGGGTAFSSGTPNLITPTVTVSGSATSNNAGGQPHNNIQPTILCNRIMRII